MLIYFFHQKIKYVTITMDETITDQMSKFLRNNFNFEFVSIKPGRTRNKTAIKKITGII